MEFSSFVSKLVENFLTLGFANDPNWTIYLQFSVNKLHHSEQSGSQWTQYLVNNDIQKPNLALFNDWLWNLASACDYLPEKDVSNASNTSRKHRNSSEPNRKTMTNNQIETITDLQPTKRNPTEKPQCLRILFP